MTCATPSAPGWRPPPGCRCGCSGSGWVTPTSGRPRRVGRPQPPHARRSATSPSWPSHLLNSDLLLQHLDSGTDPLERNAGATEARENEGLGETDEGNSRLSSSAIPRGIQLRQSHRRACRPHLATHSDPRSIVREPIGEQVEVPLAHPRFAIADHVQPALGAADRDVQQIGPTSRPGPRPLAGGI
jgi:hypothetical protein